MVEIIEILRQDHRNIEKLLGAMEQELTVFNRGECPDYEVLGAIVEFFENYPDSCHHPKEDIIYEKFRTRDPGRAQSVGDLEAEHREGAVRLRRVAQAIESVLNDARNGGRDRSFDIAAHCAAKPLCTGGMMC